MSSGSATLTPACSEDQIRAWEGTIDGWSNDEVGDMLCVREGFYWSRGEIALYYALVAAGFERKLIVPRGDVAVGT